MRVGLNLLHALPEIGGGWNYIAKLLAGLGEYGAENQYVAFVNSSSAGLVPGRDNFEIVQTNVRAQSRSRRVIFENTRLQGLARRSRLNCLHWFANTQGLLNPVPTIVTVYDLQAFLAHASYGWHKRLYLRAMMRHAVKRAALLLPISQATADDLARSLGIPSDRMCVIPAIVEREFSPCSGESVSLLRARYGLPDRFWLYVAHLYNHKNHLRLLRAHALLKTRTAQSWPLVLRGDPQGAQDEVRRAIVELGLERDVLWAPRLSRAELAALYTAASGLVFPSLYEGSGMPVMEAMACGCAVIASDIPPVRESAGEAAFYFDPLCPESIAAAMRDFQSCPEVELRGRHQLGLTRAGNYRGQVVIQKLLDAYRRVA